MTDAEAQAIYQDGKMSTDQHKWFIVDMRSKCVVASFRERMQAFEACGLVFDEERFRLCDEQDVLQLKDRWHEKILNDARIARVDELRRGNK